MAIWQYDLFFIPREDIIRIYGTIPEIIENSLLEQIMLNFKDEAKFDMSHILSKTTSWSKDIISWGDLDSNYFSIVRDGDVIEVEARIDVRLLSIDYIHSILDLAQKNDCLFFSNNMSIIKPEFELLMKNIYDSDAYNFVKNPRKFIDKLKK